MACAYDFASNARHQIDIEQLNKTADNYGGQTVSWLNVATCWAVVTPMSGKEVMRYEQLQSRVTHKFLIRYDSSVSNTKTVGGFRILLDSKVYSVQHVRNLDDKLQHYGSAYLELVAEENASEVQEQ